MKVNLLANGKVVQSKTKT
ncbi:hypothetical protein KCX75_09635 (plasmid) [Lactobacillus gasseri]